MVKLKRGMASNVILCRVFALSIILHDQVQKEDSKFIDERLRYLKAPKIYVYLEDRLRLHVSAASLATGRGRPIFVH